ncbi:MAG: hypothetical protein EOP85_22700 [Verrucomicrobiaceae bacterium]|nr:MAG: hypothetical protein EOP85_22700 [Verrucomicrobiaceae bacterium]
MVVEVAPYSLVSVAERLNYGKGVSWRFFQIGSNFDVTLVESRRKLGYDEIRKFMWGLPEHQSASLLLSDHDLMEIFRSPQPEWFRRIAEAQAEHWRINQTACYARIAPNFPEGGDISRCIEAEPFTMLERWRHLMASDQLRRCAELSPSGAVRFAFDHIPPDRRDEYLSDHAAAAVTHSFTKLTGPDLVVCARVKPDIVYEKRGSLSPELGAHVLATAYQFLWPSQMGPPSVQIRNEILQSLREHPEVWLSLHDWSFVQIHRELQRLVSIRPDWDDVENFYHHADPEVRHAFLNFVATQI